MRTSGSSFAKAMGFGSVTLKNDENELDNIEDSAFKNFKPQQRLFCERKLKSGQLKFDELKKNIMNMKEYRWVTQKKVLYVIMNSIG